MSAPGKRKSGETNPNRGSRRKIKEELGGTQNGTAPEYIALFRTWLWLGCWKVDVVVVCNDHEFVVDSFFLT